MRRYLIKRKFEELISIPENESFIRIYNKKYWLSDEEDNLYFYKTYHSPQCNSNRSICESSLKNIKLPYTKVIYLDKVYLPFDPDEWCN